MWTLADSRAISLIVVREGPGGTARFVLPGDATPMTDRDLQPDSSYTYHLCAANGASESLPGPSGSGHTRSLDVPVWLVGEGRDRHSFVAARDMAALAVNALDNPAALDQTICIGGPAALSWIDAVRVFERTQGRPIQVNNVQPGEPLPGLPPFMAELMAGFARLESIIPMDEIAPRYGVQLTPLEGFVQGVLVTAPQPARWG